MATSFLTNLTEDEFKSFLKQALIEVITDQSFQAKSDLSKILDIKQASEYLRLQVTTIYEKTSQKTIPHFQLKG